MNCYFLFRNNLVMHIYLLFISIVNLLNFQLVSLRGSTRFSYTLLKPNVSAEYCFNKC